MRDSWFICSRGRLTSTRRSLPYRAWGSITFTLGGAGVQPGGIDIHAIDNQIKIFLKKGWRQDAWTAFPGLGVEFQRKGVASWNRRWKLTKAWLDWTLVRGRRIAIHIFMWSLACHCMPVCSGAWDSNTNIHSPQSNSTPFNTVGPEEVSYNKIPTPSRHLMPG